MRKKQELTDYELDMRDLKASILADCFIKAMLEGYDSEKFITIVMTNITLEDLIFRDERQEWSCGTELLINIERRVALVKSESLYDEYELWFMGYLYKYWMRTTGERPAEIFKYLPVIAFHRVFGFYHTQGWEYIIQDAKKMHARGEW